jgi:hypothetical protein
MEGAGAYIGTFLYRFQTLVPNRDGVVTVTFDRPEKAVNPFHFKVRTFQGLKGNLRRGFAGHIELPYRPRGYPGLGR